MPRSKRKGNKTAGANLGCADELVEHGHSGDTGSLPGSSGDADMLLLHFGGDRESLAAFLDLQRQDLRALTDAALARDVAEATVLGPDQLSDEQLAQQLAEQEELQWAQEEHDSAFAKELENVSDDEWEEVGDNIEKHFDAAAALKPSQSASGFKSGVCGICMERSEYLVIIPQCDHAFCHACLKHYIFLKVQEHVAPIHCCSPQCMDLIEPDLVRRLVGSDIADAHERNLAEAAMSNKVFCPFADCGEAYELEEEVAEVRCMQCKKHFCATCRVPWHEGFTCQEYQDLPDHLRAPEDVALLQMARRNRWRTCPECRNLLSKQEGDCNWMRCRCACCFCFRCGNKYLDDAEHAGNVHGHAGCMCPLFEDTGGEDGEPAPLDLLQPPQQPQQPQPEQPQQPRPEQDLVGLVGMGNAKMRRFQYVDLVKYHELVEDGHRVVPPRWLASCIERKECCYCARTFLSLEALNQHLQTTRQHAVYACCGRIFLDGRGFSQHIEVHRKR